MISAIRSDLLFAIFVIFCVMIFLTGCNKEDTYVKHGSPTAFNCLLMDCVSSTNPNLIVNSRQDEQIADQSIISAAAGFIEAELHWTEQSHPLPAWRNTTFREVKKMDIVHYYVPFYYTNSNYVEGLLSITHQRDSEKIDFEYMSRTELLDEIASPHKPDPIPHATSFHNTQAWINSFLRQNRALFDNDSEDIIATSAFKGISLRKCSEVPTPYTIVTTWHIYGGTGPDERYLYSETTYISIDPGTGGCGGPSDNEDGSTTEENENAGGSGPRAYVYRSRKCNDPTSNCEAGSSNSSHFDLLEEGEDYVNNEVDCVQEPCLCAAINRFGRGGQLSSNLNNLSNEISMMIEETFDVQSLINLDITTSAQSGTTLGSDVLAAHNIVNKNVAVGALRGSITFNSNKNMSCTEAHLASTLIHEAMHAYIEYQDFKLSSKEFNQLYPLYDKDNKNLSHHVAMANKFVGTMSRSLRSMYPKLSKEFADALSWEGLHKTAAYDLLSSDKKTQIGEYLNKAKCIGDPVHPAQLDDLGLKPCI